MQYEFTVQYPSPLMKKVAAAYWWHFIGRRAAVLVVLELLAVIVLRFVPIPVEFKLIAVATLPLTAAAAIAFHYLLQTKTLKGYDRLGVTSAEIKLADDHIATQTTMGGGTIKWQLFRSAIKQAEFWMLFYETHLYITLPTANLDADTLDFIASRIPKL